MGNECSQISGLLAEWSSGDQRVLGHLMPKIEKELRRIAERYFKRENPGHTLEPTALVNEFYLRLVGRRQVSWKNRAHFFGFAANTMRKILVDHARARLAAKRGQGVRPLPLDEVTDAEAPKTFNFLGLEEALARLAKIEPRQERVVVLRAFAGFTHEEIAEKLGVTCRTVKRDWRTARLWLYKELEH